MKDLFYQTALCLRLLCHGVAVAVVGLIPIFFYHKLVSELHPNKMTLQAMANGYNLPVGP